MTHGSSRSTPRRGRRHVILLLLSWQGIGTLWGSTCAKARPALFGFPFFYWYQFLWIAISATLTVLVYLVEREPRSPDEDPS